MQTLRYPLCVFHKMTFYLWEVYATTHLYMQFTWALMGNQAKIEGNALSPC